jgi:hypothetical protein
MKKSTVILCTLLLACFVNTSAAEYPDFRVGFNGYIILRAEDGSLTDEVRLVGYNSDTHPMEQYFGGEEVPDEVTYHRKTYKVVEFGPFNDSYNDYNVHCLKFGKNMRKVSFYPDLRGFSYLTDGFEVSEENKHLKAIDGILYTADGKTLLKCHRSLNRGSSPKRIAIPDGVETIELYAFISCSNIILDHLPESLKEIKQGAFEYSKILPEELVVPEGVRVIDRDAFSVTSVHKLILPSTLERIGYLGVMSKNDTIVCLAPTPPAAVDGYGDTWWVGLADFFIDNNIVLMVPPESVELYRHDPIWGEYFKNNICAYTTTDYRPFVEEGKVWKVGALDSGNPMQMVEYYYFDGDTIIDGKACKQMMRQRYVNPNYINHEVLPQDFFLREMGAWYEEDKKVYAYNTMYKEFRLMYDFSLNANDTLQGHPICVIGPRQTEGIKGFKGVYRNIMDWIGEKQYICDTWLEGVGHLYGPTGYAFYEEADYGPYLMSCTVGDEVIYFNDDYEDGATPAEARKRRFDFTHTIKIQPKARHKRGAGVEQSIYGEYNDLQLGINLDPLDDAYLVRITDESGKAVYEKNVNTGNIVGLNIDISNYAEGRYTITVENSLESFTGEFEAQPTGIKEVRGQKSEVSGHIYNLQGQRISTLQKGLNIVNGQKVFVK